jgi:uncharacterized protein
MPWTLVAILVISIPLTAINYYVGRKLLWALVRVSARSRSRLKRVVFGIHIALNLLPIVFYLAFLVGGKNVVPAFSGDSRLVDMFLSYPFWIGLIVMIQLLALFVLLDIFGLLTGLLVPRLQEAWLRRKPLLILGSIALIALYSLGVIIHDTWTVRIVYQTIALPDEMSGLKGFRIAAISDVQGDGRTTPEILGRYVARVNSLNPDLVLFGGDLVTSGTRYIESTAKILGGLRSKFGTFAALGDHDLWANKSMVEEALRIQGVTVVEDSTVFLNGNTCEIALSVVTYTYMEKPKPGHFGTVPQGDPPVYRIMLVHQPAESVIELARNEGYNVLVAGHTHGGGVAFGIPGLFLWAPASFESSFVSGLFHLGSLDLIVTNGLGLTLAPVRFHAPAEIVLITLR